MKLFIRILWSLNVVSIVTESDGGKKNSDFDRRR